MKKGVPVRTPFLTGPEKRVILGVPKGSKNGPFWSKSGHFWSNRHEAKMVLFQKNTFFFKKKRVFFTFSVLSKNGHFLKKLRILSKTEKNRKIFEKNGTFLKVHPWPVI